MTQQHLRPEDYATIRGQEQQGRLHLLELGVSLDPDAFFLNLNPDAWKTDARRAWIVDKAFRQAISHAVDREAFANEVFLGAAVPVHGPITPGNPLWFWPDQPRLAFDRTRATALLQSLGLTNRDADPWLEDASGAEARLSVLAFRGNTSVERGAQFVKESLAAIGVDLQIVPLEPGALIERMLAGRFEGIYFNYSVTDTDPAMQRDFWSSTGSAHMWHLGQKAASTKWEDEIDLLMTRQAAATDPAERVRLFRLVQRLFADEVPVLYFAAPRLYVGVSQRVRNTTPAVIRPQLLWSADTLAVDPAAPGPSSAPR
jgi:peptide/nickel transport system substrate-binding protein